MSGEGTSSRNPSGSNADGTLWERLRNAKINIAIITLLLLYAMLEYLVETDASGRGWLTEVRRLPLQSLADACVAVSLVGIVYEWFVRAESDHRLEQIIEKSLGRLERGMAGRLSRALIFDPATFDSFIRPVDAENVIRSGLRALVSDESIGNEYYDASVSQALQLRQRCRKYRAAVTLLSADGTTATQRMKRDYFRAMVDIRFRARLTADTFRFVCVKSFEEYNDVLQDSRYEMRWACTSLEEILAEGAVPFHVHYAYVDELLLNVASDRSDTRSPLVVAATDPRLSGYIGKEVSIRYRYEVYVKKNAHVLLVNVARPAHGVEMEFDTGNTGARLTNVIDMFMAARAPSIKYTPLQAAATKVELELDDWVFPKGGALFVWDT